MRNQSHSIALRTALTYVAAGSAWILASDYALALLVPDARVQLRLEVYKGWFFVGVTGLLLYVTLRRLLEKWEAQRAARELAVNEKRVMEQRMANVSAVVEGTTEACFAVNSQWNFTFVNSRCESLFKRKQHEMLGQNFWETFDKLVGTPMEANYRKAMRERVPVSFEALSPIAGIWLDVRLFPSGDGLVVFLLDIDAQRKAEHAFVQTSLLLREGQSLGKLGNWEWNQAHMRLTWSDEVYRIFGRERHLGPASQEEVERYFAPESWKALTEAAERLYSEGTPFERELMMRQDGGEDRWVIVRGEVARDAHQEVFGIRGTIRDVTETKLATVKLERAQTALVDLEERWQLALKGGDLGVWDWNAETNEVFYSERWCTMLGFEPSEIGTGFDEWSSRVHPDDLEPALAKTRDHFEGRTPFYESEHRLRAKDGSYRWILARGQVMARTADGRALRVVGTHIDITDRKNAELLTERLVAIVESSDDAIMSKDLDGLITSWNAGATTILGYTANEMLGTPASRIIPAERIEEEQFILESISGGRSLKHFETKRQTKSGELIDVSVTASPLRDATGKVIGVSKVARDITVRKKAEEELRASEARYRALFQHAPDGILIGDKNSVYLDANASMCRMLGYELEEIVGKNATDIIAPNEVQAIDEVIASIQQGQGHHQQWHLRRKDGTIFPVEIIATMMPPEGRMLAMIRDISERKNAEDALRDSRSKLAAALESMTDAVSICDATGRFVEFNEAFVSFHRFGSKAECADTFATYQETLEVFHPSGESAPPEMWAVARALRGETVTNAEYKLRRKDTGQTWFASYSFSPIRDKDGVIVGSVVVGRDITEKKQLEHQFLRAQRMESIGTLAGGIAHDLNNVLGPIMMSLDLLKMKFTDDSSRELLDIISTSAHHGAEMVRQVLSFGRGFDGRRMEVQIRHLVGDIEKTVNDTFLKSIQMRTTVATHLWTVVGDPTQLHQVLMNLCVNARDAMPNGGALHITAENVTLTERDAALNPEVKPGPYVYLEVTDSGTGMPAEVIEKIFDPFFTTKEVGKGTGLGLSTSLAIIKGHGGFIRVVSEPGKGTTFQISLPAKTDETPLEPVETPMDLPRGNGELILVVDDEESVRQITRQTLEASGYRVLLASDGAQAVDHYATRAAEIAVVLTDMMMPLMDGPATIQILRTMNADVKIIGASGLATETQVTQSMKLGVRVFLPKPFTARTLLTTLRDVLSGGH